LSAETAAPPVRPAAPALAAAGESGFAPFLEEAEELPPLEEAEEIPPFEETGAAEFIEEAEEITPPQEAAPSPPGAAEKPAAPERKTHYPPPQDDDAIVSFGDGDEFEFGGAEETGGAAIVPAASETPKSGGLLAAAVKINSRQDGPASPPVWAAPPRRPEPEDPSEKSIEIEFEEIAEAEEFEEPAVPGKPAELKQPEEPEKLAPPEKLEELEELEEFEAAEELEPLGELEGQEELEELEEFEEPEELEPLGELEGQEELEELEEAEEPEDTGPPAPLVMLSHPSASEIAALASKIEFGPDPVSDAEENGGFLDGELEIVSPFASMLLSLDGHDFRHNEDEENAGTSETGGKAGSKKDGIEEFPQNAGLSLINRPFLIQANHEPELLQAVSGDDSAPPPSAEPEAPEEGAGDVILEQDGVNYINPSVFMPDRKTEESLDRDFQNLVDSLTGEETEGRD
jgi:hypothetical protein